MSRACVAICPTYGRYPEYGHLLEEAVESFLRQDYPNKYLLVFNDCPRQSLYCGFPQVHVHNWPVRCSSLGEKYNVAIAQAATLLQLEDDAILLPWEDDDLSLPHRIRQAVKRLENADYFNPQHSWYWPLEGLTACHTHGVCHNASAFTLGAWRRAGRYPDTSGPQDAIMDTRLKRYCRLADPLSADPAEWSYIYRWGVSPCHVSGHADSARFYSTWGQRPVLAGSFDIRPHWRTDYCTHISRYLQEMQ